MFKIIYLILGLLITSLFVGCGSGGGSSSSSSESKIEKILKREHLLINYHYPKEACSLSVLKERLESIGATDIITLTTNEYVDCESYGKVNDGEECLIQDLNYYNEPTCVVGMNFSYQKAYNPKMTNDILFLEDAKETVISAF